MMPPRPVRGPVFGDQGEEVVPGGFGVSVGLELLLWLRGWRARRCGSG